MWLSAGFHPLHRQWKRQDDDKLTSELEDYRLMILNELILIEQDRLRRRKKEINELRELKND